MSNSWPPISWALGQDYEKEIGVGEHTDYGLLTILKQVKALRALRPDTESERHVDSGNQQENTELWRVVDRTLYMVTYL